MSTATKERGILFSAPMVRAILDGRKTMTRRIVKPQADHIEPLEGYPGEWSPWRDGERCASIECPYGVVGDRLWVRETFAVETNGTRRWIEYASDGVRGVDCSERISHADAVAHGDQVNGIHRRPSIFMPRWASRIDLEITGVRVERLQEIRESDAEAEGVQVGERATAPDDEARSCVHCGKHRNTHIGSVNACWQGTGTVYSTLTCRGGLAFLWDSINGAGSWASNPWVWIVEFTRTKPETPGAREARKTKE